MLQRIKLRSMKIWDNILESRGSAGEGKARFFRPGGGRFSDLGKGYAYIRHSHTCANANLTALNTCLIDIIMLTSQCVTHYNENAIPYPIVCPTRNIPVLASQQM